jgi:hypothetical protein
MRPHIWFTIFAVTCLISRAYAHDQRDPPGPSLTRDQTLLTIARRDVFQKAMGLDDPQKDMFWNIYADYDRQRAEVTDQTLRLLRDYVTSYDTLTNEQATKMMDEKRPGLPISRSNCGGNTRTRSARSWAAASGRVSTRSTTT